VGLTDLDGNYVEYPIIIEVVCPEEVEDDFLYASCIPTDLFDETEDIDTIEVAIGVTVSTSITIITDQTAGQQLIDDILSTVDTINLFNEELIPKGEIQPITEEMRETLTEDELD